MPSSPTERSGLCYNPVGHSLLQVKGRRKKKKKKESKLLVFNICQLKALPLQLHTKTLFFQLMLGDRMSDSLDTV